MAALLIVIFAVALGNIYGQQATFRPLKSHSPVTLTVSRPDYREILYPPPWLRYPVHPINYLASGRTGDTFDLSAQNVRELEPRRRVATRNRNTNRMEGKQTVSNPSGETPKNVGVQNCSDVYDHVDFENTTNSSFNHQQNVNKTTGSTNSNATNEMKPLTPGMPPPTQILPNTTDVALMPGSAGVTEKPNDTDVSIGSRDSFNGDKCATGYVKLNNECVKVD